MNHKVSLPRTTLIVIAVLVTAILAACGTPAAVTQAPEAPAAASEPAAGIEVPEPTTMPEASTQSSAGSGVSFSADIQPVLQERCESCHSDRRASGGLDLATYAALMAGGNDGAAIVPGDAANSLLLTLVENGQMPKRGPALTDEQLQALQEWIESGAPNN